MTKIHTLAIVVVLLLSTLLPGSILAADITIPSSSSDQFDEGYRFNVQGWIYVHVQGDAYERGYQHGYLLAAEIVDMLSRWSTIIHNYPIIKSISAHQSDDRFEKMSTTWWNFCINECYRMYWDKFPEEYQQEIKGIADGVAARGGKLLGRNVHYKDILAMNEMYEFLSKLTKIPKGIHPLRTLFQQLQQVTPEISHVNSTTLLETFLRQSPAHHCNGFVATGDATSHGQLVFSQTTICGGGMWWWVYYISLRWNVILDIQPTNGHRIIMPTSPGLIWSDEDYYQNDNGLVLLETTVPQGPFDNRGLPLSIRARNAMQYGDSIDDMLYSLRYRNDGCMNAVWLLGDTKTGEIARLDLGYRHSAVWRTFNGFYWSANIPKDFRVRLERVNIKDYLINFIPGNFLGLPGWGYYSIRYKPAARDLKFEELGNKYYGNIDIEIVKEIMCTPPISNWITDVKATDSYLMKQNGLWAFFGNPHRSLNISDVGSQVVTTEEVPPAGWVRLFGLPEKEDFTLQKKEQRPSTDTTDVLWEFDTKENTNNFSSAGYVEGDTLYETIPSGVLFALQANTGGIRWRTSVGKNPTTPVVYDGKILLGDNDGFSLFSETGDQLWRTPTDAKIISCPVIIEDEVVFGDSEGTVYCLAIANGEEQWRLKFTYESYVSTTFDENLYLTSGNCCYAVKRNDQSILWEFPTNGMITAAPVLCNDVVYFSSWDTYVYAVDAGTGTLLWKYQTGWGADTTPVVSKGVVIFGSIDNNLYALNEDGTVQWIFTCQAGIHSTPAVYGGYVYFGSDDGRIYAVNQTTGEQLWSFAPRFTVNGVMNYATTPIVSDPVVANGTVIIGANGTIFGLNAQTIEVSLTLVQKNTESIFQTIPLNWYIWVLIIFVIIIALVYIIVRKKK